MHEIKLIKIRFSNVLSYGNNINEIVFNDGITWLSGANGSGKSTVIEALTYALFGKPYRSIKVSELCNTSNKSKLMVELEFERTDSRGTVKYEVKRTLAPGGSKTFTVIKDGQVLPKTAGVTQKIFEDEYLGFNQNLFQNVISMNTIQTVPFIDMEPKDKRKLIESILTLHIEKYKLLNGKENTRVTTKFNDATADVDRYTNQKAQLDTILIQLLQENAEAITDLQGEADTVFAEINSLDTQIMEHQSAKKIVDDSLSKLTEKMAKINSDMTLLNEVENAITLVEGRDSIISDIEKISLSQEPIIGEINKVKALIETCNSNSPEANNLTSEIQKVDGSIMRLGIEQGNAKKGMDKAKADNDALVVGVECYACGKPSTEDDVEKVRQSLRDDWKKHNKIHKSLTEQLNKLSVDKESLQSKLNEIKVELDKVPELTSRLHEKSTELTTLETNARMLTSQLDNADRSINGVLSKLKCTADNLGKEKTKIKRRVSKKDQIESELNELRSKSGIESEAVRQYTDKKVKAEARYSELNKKIAKKRSDGGDDAIAKTRKSIEDVILDLNRAYERVKKYSDEIEIVKYIDKMFGDNGLKKYILSTFVPSLNKAIAHNIQLFSLPFAIEFDDSLNYRFESNFGMANVYNGLSQGQKRKLNFAISMAFHDFVSLIAEFKINVMFLDEVLDISTDEEALGDMILLLKEKLADIPGIYLMSHRGEVFDDYWDHKLAVTHDGTYSSIEEVY